MPPDSLFGGLGTHKAGFDSQKIYFKAGSGHVQSTEAVKARAREDQQRQDLGTWL